MRYGNYGVTALPSSAFNGDSFDVGGGSSVLNRYQNLYNNLVNVSSPMEIDASMTITNGQLEISADVLMTETIPAESYRIIYLATYYFSDSYHSTVVRYAEENFPLTASGSTQQFSHSFDADPSWELINLKAVVIVQYSTSTGTASVSGYTFNKYPILQAATTSFTGLLPMFSANVTEGPAYLGVQFTSNSFPQTGIDSWEWDFDGDGTFDSTEENPFHLYTTPGVYDVTLRITVDGETAETTVTDFINVTDGSNISGNLSGIWLSQFNPYNVTDDVLIPEGNELVIQPGVEINFGSGTRLTVNGKLTANANVDTDDPIIMTSSSTWEGIRIVGSTQPNLIQGCEISNSNLCAIAIENGSVVDIIENKIFNNSSLAVGAAIDVSSSDDVLISKNIIANNTSTNLVGGIGAIDSAIEISNNIVVNNTGTYGAFCLKNGSDALIVNNTIANNESTNGTPYLFFLFNAIPTFINNIIIDNGTMFFAPFGDPDITYTCITGGFTGTGNIDADPLFVEPSQGDGNSFDGLNACWWLQDGSPCIDAGNPDAMYNDPDGSRNDMGAFGGPNALMVPVGNDDDPISVVATSNISIYPNPFNPQTSIALNLTESDKLHPVSVGIYNVKGQLVRTLVDHEVISNTSVVWDGKDDSGRNISSGVYFAKVDTQSNVITKKMILLK